MRKGGREKGEEGGEKGKKVQRERLLGGVSPSLYVASASPTTQPWVCPPPAHKHTTFQSDLHPGGFQI